jgi:16S rRNA (guanine527-N7)-methyltransferase
VVEGGSREGTTAPEEGSTPAPVVEAVVGVFAQARHLGLLGTGDIEVHIEHSLGFAEAAGVTPANMIDLGSGSGVPGLVLAQVWRESRVVLLEASERKARFLEDAVRQLGLAPRVRVLASRAEVAGHAEQYRHRFELVVARGFGPPAATAECGAPFLRRGGLLVVSEPPDGQEGRWPEEALRLLGLRLEARPRARGFGYARLRALESCPARFPRAVGVPVRRPLFRPRQAGIEGGR